MTSGEKYQEWKRKNTSTFYLSLNKTKDAKIIAKLEKEKKGEGYAAYIKKLILADLVK